jgi:hypothetical protein
MIHGRCAGSVVPGTGIQRKLYAFWSPQLNTWSRWNGKPSSPASRRRHLTSSDANGGRSSSGWARDRLWAQYGDAHRGVCLRFDREKLVQGFRSTVSGRGECLTDEVVYDEESVLPHPNVSRAERMGFLAYAHEYRRANASARYFRKREDWRGEREFRLVLLPPAPLQGPTDLSIAGALERIVVGYLFPRCLKTHSGRPLSAREGSGIQDQGIRYR